MPIATVAEIPNELTTTKNLADPSDAIKSTKFEESATPTDAKDANGSARSPNPAGSIQCDNTPVVEEANTVPYKPRKSVHFADVTEFIPDAKPGKFFVFLKKWKILI